MGRRDTAAGLSAARRARGPARAGACGSDDSAAPATPAVHAPRRRRRRPAPAPRRGAGVRLVEVGRVRHARLRDRAARRHATRVRRRAGRHDPRRARRQAASRGRSWICARKVIAGGEQGLLSMAFAPDYAKTRRFYVNYTDRSRHAERRRVPPLGGQRATARDGGQRARSCCATTASSPTTTAGCSPSGPTGCCTSAPATAAAADDQHGARGNAQDLGSLLGKLLRIDPRRSGERPYRVPASNPFVGRAGARAEIYSYGLRNPWRFSFDRSTGDLTIGDVGQNAVEEIDFASEGRGARRELRLAPVRGHAPQLRRAGAGRRRAGARAARTPTATARSPAATSSATAAVPALAGRYVYGDFCKGAAALGEAVARARRAATPRSRALRKGRRAVVVRRGRPRARLRRCRSSGPGATGSPAR